LLPLTLLKVCIGLLVLVVELLLVVVVLWEERRWWIRERGERGSERRERLANKLENKMLEQDFVSILGSISGRIGSISTELILNRK